MLGGGPASQHPQLQSQQIRGAMPRAVTLLSSRYPQLLWVFDPIFRQNAVRHAVDAAASCLTRPQRELSSSI
jgi:hypothetical protein